MLRLHRTLQARGEESEARQRRYLVSGCQDLDRRATELSDDDDAELLELADRIAAGARGWMAEQEKVGGSLLCHG